MINACKVLEATLIELRRALHAICIIAINHLR